MASSDSFSALGIAPTLDAAQVKRAYFAQLQKHPPHVDPEGFRRLRSAYEALAAPGALPLAFIAAPLDVAAELAAWRARWEAPKREAAERLRSAAEGSEAIQEFVQTVSRLALSAAVERFGGSKPTPSKVIDAPV